MPRTFRALASVVLVASPGCIEYDPKGLPPDPVEVAEYEELCWQACLEAGSSLPLGCTRVSCGVDVGANVVPGFYVADLLDAGPAGVCQLVTTCVDGDCLDEYEECLDESHSLHGCEEDYDRCMLTDECAEQRDECEEVAYEPYCQCLEDDCGVTECEPFDTCMGADTPLPQLPEGCETLECQDLYVFDCETCECEELECLTDDELYCGWGPMFAPMPEQTGPARWRVRRAFVEHALDRLTELRVRTRPHPVRDKFGQWIAVRIVDVSEPNPLRTLGLKSGDLVTHVNGQPIATMLDDPFAFMAALNGDLVVIKLMRGGVQRQHRYDIVP